MPCNGVSGVRHEDAAAVQARPLLVPVCGCLQFHAMGVEFVEVRDGISLSELNDLFEKVGR